MKTIEENVIILDEAYTGVIPALVESGYIPSIQDADSMSFSSGGSFEHIIIKNKDGRWLLFGNMYSKIDFSAKSYDTAQEAYDNFWSDENCFDKYINIYESDEITRRPLKAIIADIENANWIQHGANLASE